MSRPECEGSSVNKKTPKISKFLIDNVKKLKNSNIELKVKLESCTDQNELNEIINEQFMVKTLLEEYNEIRKHVDFTKLDREVDARLTQYNLNFIMGTLYLSNIFSPETDDQRKYSIGFRESERLRCRLACEDVTIEDLELMCELTRKILGPHPEESLVKSIEICVKHAKEYIDGDSDLVLNSKVPFSRLKETVKTIVGSKFFTAPFTPLDEEKNDSVDDFSGNLEDWLAKNNDKILEEIVVLRTQKRAWRLSKEVRLILRRILRKFRELHKKSMVFVSFDIGNIFLSNSQKVTFKNVEFTQSCSFMSDFQKLKVVIEKILRYASSGGVTRDCPEDVEAYKKFIDRANPQKLDAFYMHPCVWSSCDVIKNVYLFVMSYLSSTKRFQNSVETQACKIPGEVCDDLDGKVPRGSIYEAFLAAWPQYRVLPGKLRKLQILFYMRDAYGHIHQHENSGKKSLYITERELFAIFPSYLACFVEATCDIKGLSGVYLPDIKRR